MPLAPGARVQVRFVHPFLREIPHLHPLVVIQESARRGNDLPGPAAEGRELGQVVQALFDVLGVAQDEPDEVDVLLQGCRLDGVELLAGEGVWDEGLMWLRISS